MAPEMASKNCANCEHGREKSTFPRCVACLDESATGNHFPKWEQIDEPDH